MDTELVVLSLTAILLLGIAAQWLAWLSRLPSILLLLCLTYRQIKRALARRVQ